MKSNNKTKTAYAYLRVGSRQQIAEGTTLNAQKEEIKKYCRSHNIRLSEVFEDYPESANNFNRRGFIRMLGRNVVRPVDYIVATGPDRISRNSLEYLELKTRLEKLDTRFLFLDGFSDLLEEIFRTMKYCSDAVRKKKSDSNCDR